MAEIDVRDNPDEERFEARVDGELAGYAAYKNRDGLIAFIHTEVDGAFEGQGIGSALVSAALDEVRSRGDAVLPFCPFVNGYIREHSEYADLVPRDQRERFGL